MNAMRTIDCDVLVIGGGGSGLAAAASAAASGRKVTLIEKNDALGGTTAWSVGSISASATRLQAAAGIEGDRPEHHFEDMALFAGPLVQRDNPALRRLLTENVTAALHWLMDIGVRFFGPMPEPPHRVPRMHNVLPNSRAYIYHLEKECRRLGVDIRLSHRAVRLCAADGRLEAVEVEAPHGGTVRYRVRFGTVLASGDYAGSSEMKADRISARAAAVPAINETNTGDGHRLAIELGARVLNGDLMLGPEIRFVPPARQTLLKRLPPYRLVGLALKLAIDWLPDRIQRPFVMSFATTALAPTPAMYEAGAILVNRDGERFTDECDTPAYDVSMQPGGEAFIVFDGRVGELYSRPPNFISTAPGIAYAYLDDYRRSRRDIFNEAASIEELASMLKVDAGMLRNALLRGGTDGSGPSKSLRPPFYALGPVRSWILFTDGGLAVSDRLEILGKDDKPIGGFYGAGSAGQGGLILEGHGHHLAWAFTSGRIAGANAASCQPRP